MPLTLQLDRSKKRPLYQQITEQIKNQISQGHLPIGTRLPSVRQLAQDLELTRLTVHNAYSELQVRERLSGRVQSVQRPLNSTPFV